MDESLLVRKDVKEAIDIMASHGFVKSQLDQMAIVRIAEAIQRERMWLAEKAGGRREDPSLNRRADV